jgi:hypothetical protein
MRSDEARRPPDTPVRDKKKNLHIDTPTATATYHLAWPHGHNIGPPWLPTTPPPLGPRGHSEPTDPYLQRMNYVIIRYTHAFKKHTPTFL